MKRKLTTVLLLLLINQISSAQTGWFIQPSFTSQNLYDCKQSAYYNLYLGSDNGTIFKSTNNGLNFTGHTFNHPISPNTSPFKYVLGQNNDNWSAVGGQALYGYKYEYMDSIMRITGLPQPNLEAFSYLGGYFFYSANVAAGTGGNYYIKDGTHWRKDTAATTKAAGRNINYSWGALFVGDNGLIMKADSIGLTHSNGERIKWRVRPSGTNKNLNCIVGSGAGYLAVGDDGTILRSSDFGETWINITSPTTEDLYGAWLGYAYLICGANGTILRSYTQTLDKWYKQITPTTEDLYFIMSLGYVDYISGGRNGIFLRTTDGGGTLKRFIGTSIIEGLYNSSTNAMVADTISVTVRSASPPYNILETAKDKLSTSGYGLITIGPTVFNSVPYWIQINHRNSLETWSKTTQVFTNNDLYYDFYPSANKAYGNNQKQVDASPVRFALYSGDVNQDGVIDLTDVILIFNDANNFAAGYIVTDLTGDNLTDLTDMTIAFNNSGNFVSVMKP